MKKKYTYLEFLRIISCFAVIFNHTETNGFFLFSLETLNSWQSTLYCFISIFCKYAVYIFFMISGALLLEKDESLKDIFKKRILRFFSIYMIWEGLCYLYLVVFKNEELSLIYFLKNIFTYDMSFNFSYWFLVSYISFLLALPILRTIVRHINDEIFIYLIILIIVFDFIKFIPEVLNIPGVVYLLNIDWLNQIYFVYPLVGYYLHNRKKDISWKIIVVGGLIDIFLILLSVKATFNYMELNNLMYEWDGSQKFFTSFVFYNSCYLFALCKKIFSSIRTNDCIERVIVKCGSLTFGIYLMHLYFVKYMFFEKMIEFLRDTLSINCMASCFIACITTMVILGIITDLFKKIPILKKIV